MKKAMISSTARDLPEHRKLVEHACKRMGFDPIVMEDLVATSDADAIRASIFMVDESEVFIGIYAYRYGYIPDGSSVSITEMEFNRAKEKGIPRLVFLMHEEHEVKRSAIETGEAETKLNTFKERIGKEQIVRWFRSPVELQGEAFAALGKLISDQASTTDEKVALGFHPPNLIPTAPAPYIAHPYSLLQTSQVVGRQGELNLLTDWVTTNRQVPTDVRLFNLIAIGGMGKSALTWKWFNDIAPHEVPNRAGWMWWSFYESDAHYDNFIIRALAYTSGQPEKAIREVKARDREDQLWRLLDEQPFVIVLDGLERILLAYSRMDAAQMLDDDLDARTANQVAHVVGLPESAGQSFIGKHQLRLATDPRADHFLRRLAKIRNSRLLISTRLYPAALQADTGEPLPGCFADFLTGLADDDVLNLWREFKVTGSREQLLPLFRSFGNYPLLVRALAGEVARDRDAPGDFDKWRHSHPNFNPAGLPLINAKSHVLGYALQGLSEVQRKVLHTLAAFRTPATWDTLRAVLVENQGKADWARVDEFDSRGEEGAKNIWDGLDVLGEYRREPRRPTGFDSLYELRGEGDSPHTTSVKIDFPKRPCANDSDLGDVLAELEDRGLVGWDKKANRYDLHPIVRSVAWGSMAADQQQEVCANLRDYFEAIPTIPLTKVHCIDQLSSTIELYVSLVRLRRFNDAFRLYMDRLDDLLRDRLFAPSQVVSLLEMLFPQGVKEAPAVEIWDQAGLLLYLGQAEALTGENESGVDLLRRHADLCYSNNCQLHIAQLVRRQGLLFEAERLASDCLVKTREEGASEAYCLWILAGSFIDRGVIPSAWVALSRARKCQPSLEGNIREGIASLEFNLCVKEEKWQRALSLAKEEWKDAVRRNDWAAIAELSDDFGWLRTRQGLFEDAEDWYRKGLNTVELHRLQDGEFELGLRTGLALLLAKQGRLEEARTLLEDNLIELSFNCHRPRNSIEALNVLADIERDRENRDAAISAAARAFELAWCDGPPYALHSGLSKAKQLLIELGAQDVIAKLEAELPPFDESKFEPMPEVELNPKDEFWVDPATLI